MTHVHACSVHLSVSAKQATKTAEARVHTLTRHVKRGTRTCRERRAREGEPETAIATRAQRQLLSRRILSQACDRLPPHNVNWESKLRTTNGRLQRPRTGPQRGSNLHHTHTLTCQVIREAIALYNQCTAIWWCVHKSSRYRRNTSRMTIPTYYGCIEPRTASKPR